MVYSFCLRVFLVLSVFNCFCSCTTHTARQTPSERTALKAALVEGEKIILANSCSKVPAATFMAGGDAVFGSCYLTNLRFIYEESEWARTLTALSKAIPQGSDFGVKHLLKGAYEVLNAKYIVELGINGKLSVVERTGQIIIPLSDIESMAVSGSRFSTNTSGPPDTCRWLTIKTRNDIDFIFEIYNLPPDKTQIMPPFMNHEWQKKIQHVKETEFR